MTGTEPEITIRELPPRRPLRTVTRRLRGPQPPLVVTDRALGKLDDILGRQRRRPAQMLGLVIDPGGAIGLVVDEPGAEDRLFTRDGRAILFVTAGVAERFAGRVLDLSGTDATGRFTLHPADSGTD